MLRFCLFRPNIANRYATQHRASSGITGLTRLTEYGGNRGLSPVCAGLPPLVRKPWSAPYYYCPHNDTEIVANSGNHVPATQLFIEDQPNIQGTGPITWFDSLTGTRSDYGTTHSITLIVDSLAVMRVFEHLGMDMSTPQGLTIPRAANDANYANSCRKIAV